MNFYPDAGVEVCAEIRNSVEPIQIVMDRVLAQIKEKTEKLKAKEAHAAKVAEQANAARDAGDYRKAFRLDDDAATLRKQARVIKADIQRLDEKHKRLLDRARCGSGNIEYH